MVNAYGPGAAGSLAQVFELPAYQVYVYGAAPPDGVAVSVAD